VVKRIMGTAGDRIHLRDGVVYRNGVKLDEPYVIHPVAKEGYNPCESSAGACAYRDNFPSVSPSEFYNVTPEWAMTLKQHILAYLMDPNIAFILFAVGALALYVEFNHPGAVVPGTVGVVFILLAVFAFNLLPVRFAAVVLILASFALFALEAKFATHGVLAIGGIVTLTLGGLLLVDAPIPEMRVHLLTALAVSVPLGIITVFLMSIALKARANKVVTGVQGLIGEIGLTQSALSPQGKVFIHGELWDAISSATVPAGKPVIVRQVKGLQLSVDPAPSAHQTTSTISV